jgi:opacity protein-like surface antigen
MRFLIFSLVLLFAYSKTTHASLSVGLNLLFDNNNLEPDVGFAPNVGWQFTDDISFNHSIVGEIGFLGMKGTDTSAGELDASALPFLLNYKFQWNPNDILGLYSGVGLGFSLNKLEYKKLGREVSSKSLAWQLQFGTNLTFADSYRLNLGYRFLETGRVSIVKGGHSIVDLGFGYQF